jgi:hypothetical protein
MIHPCFSSPLPNPLATSCHQSISLYNTPPGKESEISAAGIALLIGLRKMFVERPGGRLQLNSLTSGLLRPVRARARSSQRHFEVVELCNHYLTNTKIVFTHGKPVPGYQTDFGVQANTNWGLLRRWCFPKGIGTMLAARSCRQNTINKNLFRLF